MANVFDQLRKKVAGFANRVAPAARFRALVGLRAKHHTTVKPPEPTPEDIRKQEKLAAKVLKGMGRISRIVKAVRTLRKMR